MTREIIEFTLSSSEESQKSAPIISKFLKDHPNVSYDRIDEDVYPDIRTIIVKSQNPITHPCFVSLENGKVIKTHSGPITEEDLDYLAN